MLQSKEDFFFFKDDLVCTSSSATGSIFPVSSSLSWRLKKTWKTL